MSTTFDFGKLVQHCRLSSSTKKDHQQEEDESIKQLLDQCFACYSSDQVKITRKEFTRLLKDIFFFESDSEWDSASKELFDKFTFDASQGMVIADFRQCWNLWLRNCLLPRSALIVIDVQNDFISGSLALHNAPAKQKGEQVVPVINEILDKHLFDLIVYTQDWHPKNHISFFENVQARPVMRSLSQEPSTVQDKKNDQQTIIQIQISNSKPVADKSSCSTPPIDPTTLKPFELVEFQLPEGQSCEQTLWPAHCVENTWGAQLHCDLKVTTDKTEFVFKGVEPETDSYSAFFDCKRKETRLHRLLQQPAITDVYLCGLATDVCVLSTGKDSLELGYRTILIEDACKGLEFEGIRQTHQLLENGGAVVVNSGQPLAQLISGQWRPLRLAVFAAKNISK